MRHIASLALLLVAACTDASLGPIDDYQASVVDDRVDINVEVCTSTPESQVFPVKIMFVVDASGSLQFTDPSNKSAALCQSTCAGIAGSNAAQCAQICAGAENPGRYEAVRKVIERFANNPAVSFSIVKFNSTIAVNGDDAAVESTFTRDRAVLDSALNTLLEADLFTDYQSGLASALAVLERDMARTDPIERTRTKYVLIFLSDGNPDPKCTKGCDNDPDVRFDAISAESWCDLPRSEWCRREILGPDGKGTGRYLVVEDDEDCAELQKDWYPAMVEPCAEYNSDNDILLKVRQMMELGEEYVVGDIQLHTAFLWAPALPPLVADVFKLDKDEAEKLLSAMAEAGNKGQFRSFSSGQEIDFLDINYSSVARPFGMTSFIVSNPHAVPALNKLAIDSDGDGLDDLAEFEASLATNTVDTDKDGYSDKLELGLANAGFDPTDPTKPVRICPEAERIDRDGDGLSDCDEKILGTDPKIADSDRDRIPDGIEFWFGTDPAKIDTKEDADVDQRLSEDEVRMHSSPITADPAIHADFLYSYDVLGSKEQIDRSVCHQFNVRSVRLVTTKARAGFGSVGYNEIITLFGEGPVDDPRDYGSFKAACVRARYVEQACEVDGLQKTCGLKDPADGKVVLRPTDFYELAELNQRRQAFLTDANAEDPCIGVAAP